MTSPVDTIDMAALTAELRDLGFDAYLTHGAGNIWLVAVGPDLDDEQGEARPALTAGPGTRPDASTFTGYVGDFSYGPGTDGDDDDSMAVSVTEPVTIADLADAIAAKHREILEAAEAAWLAEVSYDPADVDRADLPMDTQDRWDNPDTNDGIEFADESDNT